MPSGERVRILGKSILVENGTVVLPWVTACQVMHLHLINVLAHQGTSIQEAMRLVNEGRQGKYHDKLKSAFDAMIGKDEAYQLDITRGREAVRVHFVGVALPEV